nr:exodeoxyribonuclease VII large subunit [Rubeoparvulum massiliense]
MQQTTPNPYTISMVTQYLKQLMDEDPILQDCWIRGEISNFKHHSSGHMYLTLKDEKSRLKAVMFAGYNRFMRFKPKDGDHVLVRGNISVYDRDGQYQLYIKEMQLDGVGNLFQAFEQLKLKLAGEGLFAQERKRDLPSYPQVVGVLTSPTGAAVRDIISTIQRRYPPARLILYPVQVQGEEAAASIVAALQRANQFPLADVLIVGRGGGSIEELWAFNEEPVARAIAASQLPVISAVGHETDFTIADFVADVRAATPTAAAELAVPDWTQLQQRIQVNHQRILFQMGERLKRSALRLDHLMNRYAFRYPRRQLELAQQHLDQLVDRMAPAIKNLQKDGANQLRQREHQLLRFHPAQRIERFKERQQNQEKWLLKTMGQQLQQTQQGLSQMLKQLDAMSPLKVMMRGYGVIYDEKQEQVLTSVRQVTPTDHLNIRMQDGWIACQIEDIKEE